MTFTEEQWQCGPSAPPLPTDEILKTWTADDLFNAYKVSWQWGNRCSQQLDIDHQQYIDGLKDRGIEDKNNQAKKASK